MSRDHDSSDRSSTPSPAAPARTPPSAERWRRIVGLVEVALDLEKPLRAAYLEAVTRQDPELRRQVHRMLRHFGIEGWQDVPTPEGSGGPAGIEAERIGPYRLQRVLGRGGMGVVYLAERHDREFERQVAIKVIGAGHEAPIVHQRFLSERQILARFDHPNIARLFEGGTTADGRPYFVLEYVDGLPLDTYCETHRLTLEGRLRIFADVCSAVSYAHQNLVVHRDLKPSNILVDRDGKAKLLDFGIAKLLDPAAMPFEIEPTRTALRPMTPSYAAPEQIAGARITTATDVYSLGVLLYRLLTGRLPFELAGQLPAEEMNALQRQDPPRPSQVVAPATWASQDPARIARRLRGDLDNIVRKALRFEPEQRYGSVAEFADDLRSFERGEPVSATRDTPIYALGKFVRRYRWTVAITGLVLLLLTGFLIASQRQALMIARERDRAESSARESQVTRDFLVGLLQVANTSSLVDNKVPLGQLLDQGFARLERGEVESASARAGLFEVLAGSYESLRDFSQAARARNEAVELARQLGRPREEIRSKVMSMAADYYSAADFDAANAALESARLESSPEERLQIDLRLLELEGQLGKWEQFHHRANRVLQELEPNTDGEITGLLILTMYLNFLESRGAAAKAVELAAPIRALAGHRSEPLARYVQSRALLATGRAYVTLGQKQKAFELLEELQRQTPAGPDERLQSGALLLAVGLAELRIGAGDLDSTPVELDRIATEIGKMLQVDPRNPRSRFLAARTHLLRCELAGRRGEPHRPEDAAAALGLLAELRDEMPLDAVGVHYGHALLLGGRLEEARVLIAELASSGSRNVAILDLAAKAGLELSPAAPVWQLELPSWLQERLATTSDPRSAMVGTPPDEQ